MNTYSVYSTSMYVRVYTSGIIELSLYLGIPYYCTG